MYPNGQVKGAGGAWVEGRAEDSMRSTAQAGLNWAIASATGPPWPGRGRPAGTSIGWIETLLFMVVLIVYGYASGKMRFILLSFAS